MNKRPYGIALVACAVGVAAWLSQMDVPFTRAAHDLTLSQVTAAPLEDGSAAVFLRIDNRGAPDLLTGVESKAGPAYLYAPESEAGVPTPTGSGAELAADGAHIRIEGEFAHGQLVPLSLTFAEAGQVTARARMIDPKATGEATEVGLFGLGGICRVGEGEPAPAISLSAEPDGEGWRILVAAEEFTFSDERTGLMHVPGEGHGHLYVGGMKMGRLYAPEARIGALPPGRHTIRVTLNTNDHRAYVVGDTPVTASVVIDVPRG